MTKIKNQCMGFMLTAIPLLSLLAWHKIHISHFGSMCQTENLEYSKTLTTQGSTELTS